MCLLPIQPVQKFVFFATFQKGTRQPPSTIAVSVLIIIKISMAAVSKSVEMAYTLVNINVMTGILRMVMDAPRHAQSKLVIDATAAAILSLQPASTRAFLLIWR